MKRLSFRQKLIVNYVAFALVLIFVSFGSVSYYINELQKRNLEASVELANKQAQIMADSAMELLVRKNMGEISDKQLEEGLSLVTNFNVKMNKDVLYTVVVAPNGDRYIKEPNKEPYVQRNETAKDVSSVDLPNGNKLELEISTGVADASDISVPIVVDGTNQGKVQVKVRQSKDFQAMEETSKRISLLLVYGCIGMLLFLLLIYWILWRMFFRQLELQQKNARLDRMAYVGSLASGLAHEIRNPLSSMNVNLEVIREELGEIEGESAAHTRELSGRVQREVLQLNNTLTSFLDFALPRKEGYSQFAMRGLVEELIDAHSEEMKGKDITVELHSPPANQTIVEADRRLIHQALRNVMVNAIQVLGDSVKKVIRIKVEELSEDRVRVSIADSGPGISPDNLAKIFEMFFSTKKGGSGFGLAIARKVLEEHHGKLWARNNEEARGAEFIMELPRFAAQITEDLSTPVGGTLLPWGVNRQKEKNA